MFDANVQRVMDEVDALRERVDDHWQVPRGEARLLAQLIRAGRCRSVCEIGASYGFSTLHLAAATRDHAGHVHSFDISAKKIEATRDHLTQAGLIDHVTLHLGDARDEVKRISPAQPYDFVFIDAVKEQCFAYFEAVWPHLAAHALIATDNTHTHPDALASFVAHLRAHPELRSDDVAVGNGFELSVRVKRGA